MFVLMDQYYRPVAVYSTIEKCQDGWAKLDQQRWHNSPMGWFISSYVIDTDVNE